MSTSCSTRRCSFRVFTYNSLLHAKKAPFNSMSYRIVPMFIDGPLNHFTNHPRRVTQSVHSLYDGELLDAAKGHDRRHLHILFSRLRREDKLILSSGTGVSGICSAVYCWFLFLAFLAHNLLGNLLLSAKVLTGSPIKRTVHNLSNCATLCWWILAGGTGLGTATVSTSLGKLCN